VEGVRSGTQNELIRQVAIEGGQFIGPAHGLPGEHRPGGLCLFPPSTAPAARLTSIGGYNVPVTLVLFCPSRCWSPRRCWRGLGRSRPGVAGRPDRTGRWARLASALGRTRRRPAARGTG